MKQPSEHAVAMFKRLIDEKEDRDKRRLCLLPSDVDVIEYLVFCAKNPSHDGVGEFLSKFN